MKFSVDINDMPSYGLIKKVFNIYFVHDLEVNVRDHMKRPFIVYFEKNRKLYRSKCKCKGANNLYVLFRGTHNGPNVLLVHKK